MLGARTNRYGDFMDICCALVGRAPYVGLHKPENRYATVLVETGTIGAGIKQEDVFYAVLGSWLGRITGEDIAVISGLPADVSDDQLKSLGASALYLVFGAAGDLVVCERLSQHRLLKQTVKEEPSRSGSTAVEAEDKLIQIVVELLWSYRSLMSPK